MFHILIEILLLVKRLCFIHFKRRIVSNKLFLILIGTLIMSFGFAHGASCFAPDVVFYFGDLSFGCSSL